MPALPPTAALRRYGLANVRLATHFAYSDQTSISVNTNYKNILRPIGDLLHIREPQVQSFYVSNYHRVRLKNNCNARPAATSAAQKYRVVSDKQSSVRQFEYASSRRGIRTA